MSNNNYIYPSHPLQPRDELLLQISSNPDHKHDMFQGHNSIVPQNYDVSINNTQATKSSSHLLGPQDERNKRVVHRDVERQRRQEMNGLYSSLRSLLPLEYIKGKRSISDHMHEAAGYIKHLEKGNKDLRSKRDKIKRLHGSSGNEVVPEGYSAKGFATVGKTWQGVEIVVGSGMSEGVVPLSRVLELLAQEGLSAVSCVSTKVNERLIHTVQTEVSNQRASDDTSGLQQKLMNLVRSMT